MKSFAITLLLFVFTGTMFASAPSIGSANATIVAARNANSKGIEMRVRGANHVRVGSAIATELYSLYAGEAHLVVENAEGARFVEQSLVIDQGLNLLKLNVAEIPTGIYFVKVNIQGRSETATFVVK